MVLTDHPNQVSNLPQAKYNIQFFLLNLERMAFQLYYPVQTEFPFAVFWLAEPGNCLLQILWLFY